MRLSLAVTIFLVAVLSVHAIKSKTRGPWQPVNNAPFIYVGPRPFLAEEQQDVQGKAKINEDNDQSDEGSESQSLLAHPSGSCKYPDVYKLEVALLLIKKGGTIIVCSGNFSATPVFGFYDVVKEGITIRGERTGHKGAMPIIQSAIRVRTSHVTIEDLKFEGDAKVVSFSVVTDPLPGTDADFLEVRNCIFRGISGVVLRATRFSQVHDCLFDTMAPPAGFNILGFAVFIAGSTANSDRGTLFNEVYNNKIANGDLQNSAGIIIGDNAEYFGDMGANMFNRVRDNIIKNAGAFGIYVFNNKADGYTTQATIENNMIFNMPTGIFIDSGSGILIQNNKLWNVRIPFVLGGEFNEPIGPFNNVFRGNEARNQTGALFLLRGNAVGNVFDENVGAGLCASSSANRPTNIFLPNNRIKDIDLCFK